MKIAMGILSFKQNWEGGVVKRTTALAKRSDYHTMQEMTPLERCHLK